MSDYFDRPPVIPCARCGKRAPLDMMRRRVIADLFAGYVHAYDECDPADVAAKVASDAVQRAKSGM